jgi:hypothetical protein
MATFGRKKERLTMQRAIEEAMAQMGMSQLTFVVTADLATKISSLMWKAHDEDLIVKESTPFASVKRILMQ